MVELVEPEPLHIYRSQECSHVNKTYEYTLIEQSGHSAFQNVWCTNEHENVYLFYNASGLLSQRYKLVSAANDHDTYISSIAIKESEPSLESFHFGYELGSQFLEHHKHSNSHSKTTLSAEKFE